MQETSADIFALKNSGLDAFLYADVGAEVNGSTLTILSVLARLGKDPWAEATKWTALPKPAVIDSLAQSIAQMPLAPSALAGARDSAARLVQLLPRSAQSVRQASDGHLERAPQKWMLLAILYFVFTGGMILAVDLMSKPSSDIGAQIEHSPAVNAANHPATRLPRKGATVAEMPVAMGRQ